MNILFIETSLSPHLGGVERVTWQISSWLKIKGHKSFYAYYKGNSTGFVPEDDTLRYDLSMTEAFFVDIFEAFIVKKHIDIVVSQGIVMWQIWALFKRLRTRKICKCVFFYHNTPSVIQNSPNSLSSRIFRLFAQSLPCNRFMQKVRSRFYYLGGDSFIYKIIYRNVDQFLLLSEFFRHPFLKRIQETEDHITCIHNPLTFHNNDQEFINKEKTVLFLCRIEERQKNITGALRIWKHVEDFGLNDWHLEIVGDGPDLDFVKQYANELGLKRVCFLGATRTPEVYFKKSSIFIMTSNYEGFGITLTEAQEFGCVPIVFDTFDTLKEIVVDGINGVIVNSGDEDSYAKALIKLMENDATRMVLAKKSKIIISKFNIDLIGAKWISMFNRIV